MEISEVRVFLRNEPRLKAYVTVTFDDCFVVRNMKVIHGDKGLFVSMPSRKMADGTFKDIAHPISNEMRHRLESKVLEAYDKKLKETPPAESFAEANKSSFAGAGLESGLPKDRGEIPQ
ncbi:MAG: septation regulator SpoVG [Elusimicrobiota bacterium]